VHVGGRGGGETPPPHQLVTGTEIPKNLHSVLLPGSHAANPTASLVVDPVFVKTPSAIGTKSAEPPLSVK